MHCLLQRRPALLIAALLFSPGIAHAKKVICIDDHDDPGRSDDLFYFRNHEGYERARGLGAKDKVLLGGSLTDCLSMVEDGDELILVMHGICFRDESGVVVDYGFSWGGVEYDGFGDGEGEMPLPPGFGTRRNVTIKFCSCWSTRDPDGDGPGQSNAEKLKAAMGGGARGHVGSGFEDVSLADVCFGVRCGTPEERQRAIRCLQDDPSWRNAPPVNRPGTGGEGEPKNQEQVAQEIVDRCLGAAGIVKVTIPNQVGRVGGDDVRGMPGYKPPRNVAGNAPEGGGGNGCACESLPGCGLGTASSILLPDPLPSLGLGGYVALALVLLAGGALRLSRRST